MKVRALMRFLDAVGAVDREPGETFEVSEERMQEINQAGFGILVEAVEPKPRQTKKAE